MEGKGLYVHSVSDNSQDICFGPIFSKEKGNTVIHRRSDGGGFEQGSLPLIVDAFTSGPFKVDAFPLFCFIVHNRQASANHGEIIE